MALQDLVGGAGCAPGNSGANNPLAAFAHQFDTEQELHNRAREFQGLVPEGFQETGPDAQFLQQHDHVDPTLYDDFLRSFDGQMQLGAAGGGGATQDLDFAFEEALAGRERVPPAVHNPQLQSHVRHFLMSLASPEADMMPAMTELARQFPEEKLKIRNRATVLSRHFDSSHNQQVAAKLDSFLRSMDAEGPTPLAVDQRAEEWSQELSLQAQSQASAWVNEFESRNWVDDFRMEAPTTSQLEGNRMAQALQNTMERAANPKFQQSQFLQFLSKINSGEAEFGDNEVLMKNPQANSDLSAAWGDAEVDGAWADAQNAMGGGVGDMNSAWNSAWLDGPWDEMAGSVAGPVMSVYEFAPNNPYLEHSDPYNEGLQLWRAGNLCEAVLAFEAVLQRANEGGLMSNAWLSLGLTHAENDEDKRAIIALNKAVEADPQNLDALVALGVSYTNELDQVPALSHLKSWLSHHPLYNNLVNDAARENVGMYTLHQEVTDLFQRAVAQNPNDPQLYSVLGVLNNLSYDYDKAVENFEQALRLSPSDHSLRNKLGATLANSNRSAEAVDAYIQALELKPNYVRALANLGIAYANQGLYTESACCYLRALQCNPAADHIWSSLRLSLTCSDRPNRSELLAMTDSCNPELFKAEFDF